MPFNYKSKEDFVSLDIDKRCYYLARLYINRDTKPSTVKYKPRLFMCLNYLKKQPEGILSVLYNYLSDNKHHGLMIWDIVPKAVLYDQERRRNVSKVKAKEYKDFDENMLHEILDEWTKGEENV